MTLTSDARDAIQAVFDSVSATATDVDVRLALPSDPTRVAVDEELVERMLQPLLDNAVRYGRSVVDVSLVRNGEYAIVHVVDDGPGVAEHERRRSSSPAHEATRQGRAPTAPGSALRLPSDSPAAPAARSRSCQTVREGISRSPCRSLRDHGVATATTDQPRRAGFSARHSVRCRGGQAGRLRSRGRARSSRRRACRPAVARAYGRRV